MSDTAFDSAFTRDKETLKKIGVDIEVKPRGDELIYRLHRSNPELLKLSLEELSLLDLASTAWNDPSTTELASTKLRASSAENRKSSIDFHLSGCLLYTSRRALALDRCAVGRNHVGAEIEMTFRSWFPFRRSYSIEESN